MNLGQLIGSMRMQIDELADVQSHAAATAPNVQPARAWGATTGMIRKALAGGKELTAREIAAATGLEWDTVAHRLPMMSDVMRVLGTKPLQWKLKA